MARAAMVVLSYPELEIVEVQTIVAELAFPYIPGLLSFREAPLILELFQKLRHKPDLLFVDGQGIAHPRRLGIASHLGLWLDMPTIGCAKTRLCGKHDEAGQEAGSTTALIHEGEVVGTVLRTRAGSRPLYISGGHKISLEESVRWTLACTRSYRLPEPSRLAHLAAGGNLAAGKRVFALALH
jgi:deoxyribonuclease V